MYNLVSEPQWIWNKLLRPSKVCGSFVFCLKTFCYPNCRHWVFCDGRNLLRNLYALFENDYERLCIRKSWKWGHGFELWQRLATGYLLDLKSDSRVMLYFSIKNVKRDCKIQVKWRSKKIKLVVPALFVFTALHYVLCGRRKFFQ